MNKLAGQNTRESQGIHIMAKPIGPVCNLKCEYCFYLEKQALFPKDENYRMSDKVLSATRRFTNKHFLKSITGKKEEQK